MQDKLAELAKRINNQVGSQQCVYCAADVGDYKSVDDAVASAVEEVGVIDILINNVSLHLHVSSIDGSQTDGNRLVSLWAPQLHFPI